LVNVIGRIPQNVAHLFLHAAPVTPGTALEASFHTIFQIPHDKLSHGASFSM
jgi:hypothetical protein